MSQGKPNNTAITIGVLAIVLAIAGGVSLLGGQDTEENKALDSSADTATATAVPTATQGSATATPTTPSAYKDGTYTATGVYNSPGGTERLSVSLTLVSGIVTATTVSKDAQNQQSREFQIKFAENYSSQVVGKKIDDLNLGKISGSSLTPKGFNAAVSTIKSQAKS